MRKGTAVQIICLVIALLQIDTSSTVSAFSSPSLVASRPQQSFLSARARVVCFDSKSDKEPSDNASDEPGRLLARAREIRESIPEQTAAARGTTSAAVDAADTAEEEEEEAPPSVGYRLYVDIGRESGTWMDFRWGASGKRIELTVDVDFQTPYVDGGVDVSLGDEDVIARMVKDNFGGKSSPVRIVTSSENARLRGGFDKMACRGGGYRIDVGGGNAVVRFYIDVDGTPETGSSYGDISVPKGCLYFSIPCFGNSVSNLSSKESPVTVRQIGWHTGWRRQESRIVGVFRAVPIDEARRRDRY